MLEVIKDYLISVGMQVDKQSFGKADRAIKEVDKGLGKFSNSALGKFVKVGAGATALAVSVAGAMAKFASSVAEADRQVGLLAKRLYTTKENARSLSIAMKQMNVSSIEQLRELAQDPESRQQFLELKSLARSLENPKTKQALKEIRAINFEFKKLMVRFEYFKMEVASKILDVFKKLKPTIQKIIDWFKPIFQALKGLKASVKGALPNIIKGIKYMWQLLKPILNIIRATVMFVIKGWEFIFKGIKEMPSAFKTAFSVIKFVLDPLIKIFRFIEDLMVYLGGGKSYREKLFDKVPWLRNIREGITGEQTENQKREDYKETVTKAQRNLNTQNIFGVDKFKRSYKWGEQVGGFQAGKVKKKNGQYIIDENGLVLSGSNIIYAKELSNALGTIANKFKISSGWEGGHSIGSMHNYGRAMDFGFAGTSLQDQLALIRAVLNSANTMKAYLEVDANTKNQIYNQLMKEGYDVGKNSKLQWIEREKGSNHLHTENVAYNKELTNAQMSQYDSRPNVVNNTFNINSTDPKESMAEADRTLNLMFGKGGISPK